MNTILAKSRIFKITASVIVIWAFLSHILIPPEIYATELPGIQTSTITSYTSTSQLPGYQETLTFLESGQQAIQAAGNTYYVSLTGSDSNDGSQAKAWKNLNYAISKLKAGDTLYIMEGTYQQTADLKSSGTETAYI